ncbi:MAG: hypothetical protein HGA65_14525 [Oscillochloris sp.]|nr:hypothetical protein [Oscillochloris sp.]
MQISILSTPAALSSAAPSLARSVRWYAPGAAVDDYPPVLVLVIIGETLAGPAQRLGTRLAGAATVRRANWPSIIVIDGSGSDDRAPQRLVGSAHDLFAS